MKRTLVVLLVAAAPAAILAQGSQPAKTREPEPCPRPSVSFKWVGSRALFLTTDAKFAPLSSDPGLPKFVADAIAAQNTSQETSAAAQGVRPASKVPAATGDDRPQLAMEGATVKTAALEIPASPPNAPATSGAGPGSDPSYVRLAVLSRDARESTPRLLLKVSNLDRVAYLGVDADPGARTQTFPVPVDGAPLLALGGRVTVAFIGLDDCHNPGTPQRQAVVIEDAVALEQHHLALDLGIAYVLDADGSFKAHPELSLNATSRWLGWLSGGVDVRAVKIEAVEPSPTPQGGGATDQPKPFLQTGGSTIDAAGRLLLHPWWMGEGTQPCCSVAVGAGLRSMVSDSSPDVRLRTFGGARLQVLGFNAGGPAESFADTRGYLEAGVAWDQFWEGSNPHRLYAEGQLEIPALGNKWVRFLARLRMDRPWFSETGASEVRLSVLTSLNPGAFKALLGGSP